MSFLFRCTSARLWASICSSRLPVWGKCCKRTIVDLSLRRFFPKRSYDGVKLVYENNNMLYIGLCHGSVLACGTVLAAWNILVLNHPEVLKQQSNTFQMDYPIVFLVSADLLITGLFLFCNTIRVRSLSRITYDPVKKLFEAKKFDFFYRNRRFTFKPGEVQHVTPTRKLTPNANFMIKSKQYYLHTGDFKSPLYYNIMLGQYNPMDVPY